MRLVPPLRTSLFLRLPEPGTNLKPFVFVCFLSQQAVPHTTWLQRLQSLWSPRYQDNKIVLQLVALEYYGFITNRCQCIYLPNNIHQFKLYLGASLITKKICRSFESCLLGQRLLRSSSQIKTKVIGSITCEHRAIASTKI